MSQLFQQVIHTIKSKHYSYNTMEPASMAAVKVVNANRNARKFSLSNDNDEKTLSIALNSIHKK